MTVAGHLAGKPPHIVGLYRYLPDVVRQIGPVTVDPQGRAIAFQVRARSIGVTPRAKWVDLTLWLKSQHTHPRVRKVWTTTASSDAYSISGSRTRTMWTLTS